MCVSMHTRKQTSAPDACALRDLFNLFGLKSKNKTLVLAQLVLAQHPRELPPGLHPHFYGAVRAPPFPMCWEEPTEAMCLPQPFRPGDMLSEHAEITWAQLRIARWASVPLGHCLLL